MSQAVTTAESDLATFVARDGCIACGSTSYDVLDSGRYSDDPVKGFINDDPWGENPLPYLGDSPWEYVRCQDCAQAYHRWLLSPTWQEIRFSQWMSADAIREFERNHGLNKPSAHFTKGAEFARHVVRLETLTRELRGDDPVRVLDFGCGWGEFLTIASQFGFESWGVDRATARRDTASASPITILPGLEEARAQIKSPLHVITLFQVLEHLDDPMAILKELRPLLAPQGYLVLEVPNCENVTRIASESDFRDIHPLEHINCFDPQTLTRFAERAGFKRIVAPTACVSGDPTKIVRSLGRTMADRFGKASTHQYFQVA